MRIGFDEPGYFSCVGDESVNAACAAPGQASMNYHRFDRALPAELARHRPPSFRARARARARTGVQPTPPATRSSAGTTSPAMSGPPMPRDSWPATATAAGPASTRVLGGAAPRMEPSPRGRDAAPTRPMSRAFERRAADPASVMRVRLRRLDVPRRPRQPLLRATRGAAVRAWTSTGSPRCIRACRPRRDACGATRPRCLDARRRIAWHRRSAASSRRASRVSTPRAFPPRRGDVSPRSATLRLWG